MWFLAGFITMLTVAVFSAWMRIKPRWSGKSGILNGCKYVTKVVKSRYGRSTHYVGIDAPEQFYFTFKPESQLDRFFKAIGFSNEYQVGINKFDDAIYIASDDSDLCTALSINGDIQTHILDIFNASRAKTIQCCGGRLWVKYPGEDKDDEISSSSVNAIVVPLLQKISAVLSRIPRSPGLRWRDPFAVKAIAILAISSGLAINGGLQLLRIDVTGYVPFTIDCTSLWKIASIAGIAGAILFSLAVIYFLGRSARTHLVLIEVLLVGTFGVVTSTFSEVRDMNMEWDSGAAVRYQPALLEKQVRKGSKGHKYYYLILQDWHNRKSEYEVKVSRNFFDLVTNKDDIVIYEKPGYLGSPWVIELSKSNNEETK